MAGCWLLYADHALAGRVVIATTGDSTANGQIDTIVAPSLNESGEMVYRVSLTGTSGGASDDTAIHFSDGLSPAVELLREGAAVPDRPGLNFGQIGSFGSPRLTDSGFISFAARLIGSENSSGVFGIHNGSVFTYVKEGDDAPGGNGVFSEFSQFLYAFSENGQIAFVNRTLGSSQGADDDYALVLASKDFKRTLAREGDPAPDGNGDLGNLYFDTVVINDRSQVLFRADLTNTIGFDLDDSAILRAEPGRVDVMVREGDPTPWGGGEIGPFDKLLFPFEHVDINNRGDITIQANASSGDFLLIRNNDGSVREAFRPGQLSPDGDGELIGPTQAVHLDDDGHALFTTDLAFTFGGLHPGLFDNGLFTFDGANLQLVTRTSAPSPIGDGHVYNVQQVAATETGGLHLIRVTLSDTPALDLETTELLYLTDGIELVEVERLEMTEPLRITFISESAVNQNGQVAYVTNLFTSQTDTLNLFTPDLRWRHPGDGYWDQGANWTLGVLPDRPHDVIIDPAGALIVLGPAQDTTVDSLTVGGGAGAATLWLQNGASISTTATSTLVASTGELTGNGAIQSQQVDSFGRVVADHLLVTGALLNHPGARISGDGLLGADSVINMGTVRPDPGERLTLQTNILSNLNRVEVIDASLRVTGAFINESETGLITGRNATLRFEDGLINYGGIGLSFGTNDVFGFIENATGTITLTGNSNTTFYDDVVNDQTIQVSAGSTAVFFGAYSGAGNVTGSGTVFLEGDLQPGNSPAAIGFGGDVHLGPGLVTTIELGGLTPGVEYDRFHVGGRLFAGGTLDLQPIDGFSPAPLDAFTIATASDILGDFDSILGQTLDSELLLIPGVESAGDSGGELYRLVTAIPGDFNLDGVVGVPDLITWAQNFGATEATFRIGDANLDTLVGVPDLITWAQRFGQSAADFALLNANASATAIPEPSAMVMWALWGALARQRRGRRQYA
jgi:hypothetical protein